MRVDGAHYKNNINVFVGFVLPVLCMQCCNYQMIKWYGFVVQPPPPNGGDLLDIGGGGGQ